MIVVENTGEATICHDVTVFEDYVMADMVFIPAKDVLEIIWWEDEEWTQ